MVEPVTTTSLVGIGVLIVLQLIKLIRKGHFKSTCCQFDSKQNSEESAKD